MKKSSSLQKQQDVCAIPCFNHNTVSSIQSILDKEQDHLTELADFYKLLSNITRLKILFALAQSELCVCDIAHILELSIAATSHQLKLLRGSNWLHMRNDGKMVYYKLNNEKLPQTFMNDLNFPQ